MVVGFFLIILFLVWADKRSQSLPMGDRFIPGIWVETPSGFMITDKELNPGKRVLTLEQDQGSGKMAVFAWDDFVSSTPTLIFSHTTSNGRPTEERELTLAGKRYGVWLYYDPTDTTTKDKLEKIVSTIKSIK